MIQYMSAREAAEKWNISQRRVSILCSQNRIAGAAMLGNMWIIPRDAEKPSDARKKSDDSEKNEVAHPFIKWAGGKGQLLEVLKANLPDGIGTSITKYAEPFVGGGALLFSLLNEYEFKEVYVNDNNKELMNVFYVIKNKSEALFDKLEQLQSEYEKLNLEEQQVFYYAQRDKFNDVVLCEKTAVVKAALFIFLNKTCFNGLYRVNKSGKFNVPSGKYKNPLIYDRENLTRVSAKLQKTVIRTCDYHDVETFADEKTLVYFNPPYRPLNVTSAFTSYTENPFNDDDQREFAAFYKKLSDKGVKVMLTNSDPHNVNYDDNFFDDLYGEFNIQRITAVRMINSKADKRGNVTELLIKNY